MKLVLDCQCFHAEKNYFIVNELAAFDGEKICHTIIKCPFELMSYKRREESKWLTKNYHFQDWNSGYVPLHNLKNIIKDLANKVDFIYIKGREKAISLRSTPVMEFDEQPAFEKKLLKCIYHIKNHLFPIYIAFMKIL